MLAVLLAVTIGVAVLGAVVTARHRAQAAADLAALAAAGWLTSGHEIACAQAHLVAETMRTVVADCKVDGLDTVVTVRADAGVRGWRATAHARAGPGEPSG